MIIRGKLPGTGQVLDISIEGGKVSRIEPEIHENRCDAGGDEFFLCGGFFDPQVNGYGGVDFNGKGLTVDELRRASRALAAAGVTRFFPTLTTASHQRITANLRILARAAEEDSLFGRMCRGIHLEGPYLAYEQKGAQDPRFLRNPDPEDYMEILERSDDIARWSLAPELPGALAFGRELIRRGIQPAIAHTNATFEEAIIAFENGFRYITHFYSGISGITRRGQVRYAGVIECGYYLDGMTVEIIADGKHAMPSLIKLIYKIKGPENIVIVTDSIRGADMPEGKSILGSLTDGQEVLIEDGVAKLPDRSFYAGSVATADRLVRTVYLDAEISLIDSVRMMTETPARIMGIHNRKGSLVAGKDADIIIFDNEIDIKMTIVDGRIIYRKHS